jgi:succinyl-diaminopimelate desuccinylase
LQFDGHLDTVHLPFVPPHDEGERLLGSGSSDMKAGIAAAVEALRALRDSDSLPGGSILLTAHDLHEAPWGDGSQLDRLISEGYVGDAVLIPEPLHDILPVVGKGSATWKVTIRRDGPPVHEVMRPMHEPSVIAAGAELVARLGALSERLADPADPLCGPATVFIGQIHSGEIFNQYPQECMLEGTRRWLPGGDGGAVKREFLEILDGLARDRGTTVDCDWRPIREAFFLDQADALVSIFQGSYEATAGRPIAVGPKPFVDDGSSFWTHARVAAITHGPRAGGQHTLHEWVDVDDLVRVAHLYALTATNYCAEG